MKLLFHKQDPPARDYDGSVYYALCCLQPDVWEQLLIPIPIRASHSLFHSRNRLCWNIPPQLDFQATRHYGAERRKIVMLSC